MNYLEVFVLLQFLDFLSTLFGLRLGAAEGSPFIAWLMRSTGPLIGLLGAKFLAFAWCALCLVRRKPFAVKLANYFFAGVVSWNLYLVVNLLRSPA
jgi:hypothetical protein